MLIIDSDIKILMCGAPSRSEPSMFSCDYLLSLVFKSFSDDFQHDFAWMTNEADCTVVLAWMQVAFYAVRSSATVNI